ncbi:MAG: ethanolamine ammonia-lyase subunit EutB [Candidatus Binatia bacterium]
MNRGELVHTFVLANELKEGDLSLGGTHDDRVREEARRMLASLRVGELDPAAFVDDGVSEALAHSLDPAISRDLGALTIGELRRALLAEGTRWAERCRAGLSSEAIAGVVKIMTEDELARLSRSLANPLSGGRIAIGSAAHLGSRIQPNSPGDDEAEILFSILEGLAYGCGDVILGLNPASDDVDSIVRLERLLGGMVERLSLPTRFCVLSDIIKQTAARTHARVDVGFQSLAGTSKALAGMVGLDVAGIAELAAGFGGLYFETGQGSEVTNGAAEGIDMVTLEARTYGVARAIRRRCRGAWTIVNDVAGFIGPEVFRSAAQLERACLEDLVMAKLHGLTMGLDVCSTFHMGVEPAELARRTLSIAERGAPAYLMAVAGNADPMLGYLTTSFREHPRLRRHTGRRMATAMERRLAALGALAADVPAADRVASLYAAYAKAGGERRSREALAEEGRRVLDRLRDSGFDLGYGDGPDLADPRASRERLDGIYAHARRALYATLAPGVIADACRHAARVRTIARDRDDYLAHPSSGECITDVDAARIQALHSSRRPQLQIVVSDGLNADGVNENLRTVLPVVRRGLGSTAARPSETDVVIVNGRVRAGYHVGALLDPEVVVHLIGERPGTGLDTLSAYLTYGREPQGRSRWRPDLDHSATTAICGVHRRGKPPELAAQEIVRTVMRMLAERRSGVALGARAG